MIKEKELGDLNAPTPKDEIKYRPGGGKFQMTSQRIKEKSGETIKATHQRMLAYVDARYVQDKLDEIVGTGNWENVYHRDEKGILFCTITITFKREDGVEASVSKTDCGTESNVEQQKGEVSDAFKRCAVNFGLARDLYNLPDPIRYCAECGDGANSKKVWDLNGNNPRLVYPTSWKPKGDK